MRTRIGLLAQPESMRSIGEGGEKQPLFYIDLFCSHIFSEKGSVQLSLERNQQSGNLSIGRLLSSMRMPQTSITE